MLARVFPRSRAEAHPEEKNGFPKAFVVMMFARCGIEPARSLDKSADVEGEDMGCFGSPLLSWEMVASGRKGLVDGVGRDVLGINDGGACRVVTGSPGENLDGSVPALPRLTGSWVALPSVGGAKSGNPSWLGDSGIVSRRGVDPPLAGGPHRLGVVKPSCAWISRALGGSVRSGCLEAGWFLPF